MTEVAGQGKKIPGKIIKKWQESLKTLAELLEVPLVLMIGGTSFSVEVLASNILGPAQNNYPQTDNRMQKIWEEILEKDLPATISFLPVRLESGANPGENLVLNNVLAYPLHWPDGKMACVFCIFSGKDKVLAIEHPLIRQYRDFFEADLELFFLNGKLREQKKVSRELKTGFKKSHQEFQETVDSIRDGIIVHNSAGVISFVNKAAEKILKRKGKELIGARVEEFLGINPVHDRMNFFRDTPPAQKRDFEILIKDKEGLERVIEVTPGLEKGGAEKRGLLAFRDITEAKQQGKRVQYLSFHDNLTGLYNRAFLEEEFRRLDAKRQMPTCILIADLNGLKLINDSYGFQKGDLALKRAADILKKSCRREDIISRWGGDEFVILLPKTEEEQVSSICARIKKHCLATERGEFPISLSLGVATKEIPGEGISSLVRKAENRMLENKLLENRSEKSHILKALMKTLAENSSETEGHALRMQKMAYIIGEKMGLSAADLDRLSLVAILHDLGKAIISGEILEKPGKLSPEEWEKMKQHPVTGYRIASSTEEFMHIASLILHHHEWWDGSGYPSGLKGEKIPLLSRIISLVDAFDVMTTGRPYKKKMSRKEAATEIQRCAGTQFDPNLVGTFNEVLQEVNLG